MEVLAAEEAAKAVELCQGLFDAICSGIQADGSIEGEGDEDLKTHHLLLVLKSLDCEHLSGIEDLAVNWFHQLAEVDPREKNEKNFNPFKLIAFSHIGRTDVSEYVSKKVEVLRKHHVKSQGYAALDVGHTASSSVHSVFPTLMATDVLLNEGSPKSIEVAKNTLSWSLKEISADAVQDMNSSILAFAIMMITKYSVKTEDKSWDEMAGEYLRRLSKTQTEGLWEDSRYQSAYVFYDLAYVLNSSVHKTLAAEILTPFVKNVLWGKFFEDEELQGQNAFLVHCTLFRGFLEILNSEQKGELLSNSLSTSVFRSSQFMKAKAFLGRQIKMNKDFLDELESKKKIIVRPTFQERKFESKNQVFVLMPFGEKKWYTRDGRPESFNFDPPYENLIRPTVESLGVSCVRADDTFETQRFMEKIWRKINESKVLIADLSSLNPNVLYELGIAHTLGKKIVMITQDLVYVPSDLTAYECVIYNKNLGMEDEFKKKLRNAVEQALAQHDAENI